MLKSILVVLDGSSASKEAKHYAVNLAKEYKASLTGLGVVDTPWITAAQPEPLGGAAYKIHRDAELIHQARQRLNQMLEEFTKMCSKHQISSQTFEREGFPTTEIEKLSQEHDLIVMGKKAGFHFELDMESDLTVKHIVRETPRPLMIVGAHLPKQQSVLIAYDGSLQAARTLHMYLLLELFKGHKVQIISLAHHQKEAEEIAARAAQMCACHGVKAMTRAIVSTQKPEQVIQQTAEEMQVGMIVLGAFGHHGIYEFFFGDSTEHMMEISSIPLFLYH